MEKKEILKDCYILIPNKFVDTRGSYSPVFIEEFNKQNGINFGGVVQEAIATNKKGSVRGLHFQKDPYAQGKYVTCTKGKIIDIVVDLRSDSPTFGKYAHVELSPENRVHLLVPAGFAHGYVSLEDGSELKYMVTEHYRKYLESGIQIMDPRFQVQEILKKYNIQNIDIKEEDQKRPNFNPNENYFFTNYRYLVTGCSGQLGYDVVKELKNQKVEDVIALTSKEMDITNKELVQKIITEYAPNHIIHCAAFTNVDDAEKEKELCYKVNVEGTKNITYASSWVDAKLTFISTDYVFDGTKDTYDINDQVNPINYYGYTKTLAEDIVRKYDKSFIVRTSSVFGINGNNFIKKILTKAKTNPELKVVCDEYMRPTYTKDLAKLLIEMQNTTKYGTYHATNMDNLTWYQLAKYVLQECNIDIPIKPVSSSEFPSPAKRPKNSILLNTSLKENGFELLRGSLEAVRDYLQELKENENVLELTK